MKVLPFAALLACFLISTSTPTKVRARDDPYASITETNLGFPRPTSTNSTIVNAYGNAVQKCGPDVDASLNGALAEYQAAAGIDAPNLNITDEGFRIWANTNWAPLMTANVRCEDARDAMFAAEDEDPARFTLAGFVSSPAGPVTTEYSPASATAPGSGSSPPAPSLLGGTIGHGTPPILVTTGLIWLLVALI
ncbi:hypothetical protein DFH09DRAFT_1074577 [Mycena vulgaris]|nr:hypothetical protein DFH09DRAFT_1074577 [Mycena vulgaris]